MYNAETIKKYITSDVEIVFFESVDSTNNVLKSLASRGAKEGTVVVSRMQTGGKGTKGRSFFSPPECGIYLSILVRPSEENGASMLTPGAALAVVSAIKDVSGKKADIKWVNDVILGGKKVCGILAESSYKEGTPEPEYAVVGIGINVFEPEGGFPEELRDVAGAVFDSVMGDVDMIRSKLAARVIDSFFDLYRIKDKKKLAAEYKQNLFMLGKRIKVIKSDGIYEATAVDTDELCRLKVRYGDGSEEYLFSGEVSCRLS